MTDDQLDDLEAKAKGATPGPWETDYRQRYVFAENGVNVCEIRGYGDLIHMVPECEVIEQMRSNGTYIAAANPAAILELIAELRQAKEECLHHEDYIAELEQSSRVYDKRLADISKLLDIEHEDGSYAELSYIYHSVKRLQEELEQVRAERDWLE
ncbi:MAG: hypothetical protein E7022_06700 [Desulfovibrio desulfuricans]|nr:hypothetical protein [Desulfovibrio desulfuricans]